MATEFFGTNNTTLARSPFLSRFTQFETTDSNYVFIGFTPGLALQAAELNELQDNFHKVSTLNSILISNWTLHCIKNIGKLDPLKGFIWDGVMPIEPEMVTIVNNVVTCNIGWYYVTDPSGIKYWTYASASFSADSSPFTSGLANFTINTDDIFSSTTPVSGDTRLFDNSSGFPNTNSPGSYRIKRYLQQLQFQTSTNNFSIVQKINNAFFWPNGLVIQN